MNRANVELIGATVWDGEISKGEAQRAVEALEDGRIVYLPNLPFAVRADERRFLTPECLESSVKNVSLSMDLRGVSLRGADRSAFATMLERFSNCADELIGRLCPDYDDYLQKGPVSFRPIDASHRVTGWRKDDTLLHLDTFPSRPMRGSRILRVFSNAGQGDRVWRIGGSLEETARQFLPGVAAPIPAMNWVLQISGIVKGRRSHYDHFMLGLHDAMKKDLGYQSRDHAEFAFAPGSSWVCFTDAIPHAVRAGQFAFEKTYYVGVEAMRMPELAPVRILERIAGRKMI